MQLKELGGELFGLVFLVWVLQMFYAIFLQSLWYSVNNGINLLHKMLKSF